MRSRNSRRRRLRTSFATRCHRDQRMTDCIAVEERFTSTTSRHHESRMIEGDEGAQRESASSSADR